MDDLLSLIVPLCHAYIIKMLLRKLVAHFAHSWKGEAYLINLALSQHSSPPSQELSEQIKLLDYKATWNQKILELFETGKVAYDPLGPSRKTLNKAVKDDQIQGQGSHSDHISEPQSVSGSTQASKTREDQPDSSLSTLKVNIVHDHYEKFKDKLCLGEYIVQMLNKQLIRVSTQEQQVLQELINMFEPHKGLIINRDVYTQERFRVNQLGQMFYNPNPYLLKSQIFQINKRVKEVFSGAYGIGKSINYSLLANLYQTLALNHWVKRKLYGSFDTTLAVPAVKIIYFTLENIEITENLLSCLALQCQEISNELPQLFKTKFGQDQLRVTLDRVKRCYGRHNITLVIVFDQINVYYSDVRKIFQTTCALKGDHSLNKKLNTLVSLNLDEQSQVAAAFGADSNKTSVLKAASKEQVQKRFGTQTSSKYSDVLEREKKRRQVIQTIHRVFNYIYYNSSKTIEDHLDRFCENNEYFNLKGHDDTEQHEFDFGQMVSQPGHQFMLAKSCWFELLRQTSSKRQSPILREQYKQKIFYPMLNFSWPVWTRYIILMTGVQNFLKSTDQLKEGKDLSVSPQNFAEEVTSKLINKIPQISEQILTEKMINFVKKGSKSDILLKYRALRNIYIVGLEQFGSKYNKQKQKDYLKKENQHQFSEFMDSYQTFQIKISDISPIIYLENPSQFDYRQESIERQILEQVTMICKAQILQLKPQTEQILILTSLKTYRRLLKSIRQKFLQDKILLAVLDQTLMDVITVANQVQVAISDVLRKCPTKLSFSRYPTYQEEVIQTQEKAFRFQYFARAHSKAFHLSFKKMIEHCIDNPDRFIAGIPISKDVHQENHKYVESNLRNTGFDLIFFKYNEEKKILEVKTIDLTVGTVSSIGGSGSSKDDSMLKFWEKQSQYIESLVNQTKEINSVDFDHIVMAHDAFYQTISDQLQKQKESQQKKKVDSGQKSQEKPTMKTYYESSSKKSSIRFSIASFKNLTIECPIFDLENDAQRWISYVGRRYQLLEEYKIPSI